MNGFDPAILAPARDVARSRMRATVVVRREGEKVRNPATGKLEPSWETVYPEGPAELRFRDNQPRTGDQAGQRFAEQTPLTAFPIDGDHSDAAAGIRIDDIGTVIADPDNPGNAGITFRVAGLHLKSLSTARRLPVEVLSFA